MSDTLGSRRALLQGAALALLVLLESGCESNPSGALSASASREAPATPRLVSLAPAVTESLFGIGAGELLVGVSDYCKLKPGLKLPRVGTSITPNFEGIARLQPTLIVTEEAINTRNHELDRLARVAKLPWLTTPQIAASVRRLGELTSRQRAAEQLAQRFATELKTAPSASGPAVLLVLGYSAGRLTEVWYVRRNSLHGAALHAAGATNAINQDIAGQPRLSLQALLELDPPSVIVLTDKPNIEDQVRAQWRKLDVLRAVKNDRVRVVSLPQAFSGGPGIFELVPRLRKTLEGLGEAR